MLILASSCPIQDSFSYLKGLITLRYPFTPTLMLNNTTIRGSTVSKGALGNLHAPVTGWVSGPNSRGSLDILWGSFFTIFLCTWTAVCLNIPHPKDSQFRVLRRKAKWMFWAIVGPELILSVAIG